jgi:hypothetical protein
MRGRSDAPAHVAQLNGQHRLPCREELLGRYQHAELRHTKRLRHKRRIVERVRGAGSLRIGCHYKATAKGVQRIRNLLRRPEIRRIEPGDAAFVAHVGVPIAKGARGLDLQVRPHVRIIGSGVEDRRARLDTVGSRNGFDHQLETGACKTLKDRRPVGIECNRLYHGSVRARQTEIADLRANGRRWRYRRCLEGTDQPHHCDDIPRVHGPVTVGICVRAEAARAGVGLTKNDADQGEEVVLTHVTITVEVAWHCGCGADERGPDRDTE